MENLDESVILTVRGREYEIPFPKVGDFYKIESLKQKLSGGTYNGLLESKSNSAFHALDMIDIEASLIVLCPKIIEDLKVKNFNELGIVDYNEIKKAFVISVVPFFKKINELLTAEA